MNKSKRHTVEATGGDLLSSRIAWLAVALIIVLGILFYLGGHHG